MSLMKIRSKVLLNCSKCLNFYKPIRCSSAKTKTKVEPTSNDFYDLLLHPTFSYRKIIEIFQNKSKNSALLVVKTNVNTNHESLYENVHKFCSNLGTVKNLSQMSTQSENMQFIVEFTNQEGANQLSRKSEDGELRLRMAQLSPKYCGMEVMENKTKKVNKKNNLYEKLMNAEDMSDQINIYYKHERLSSARVRSNFLLCSILEDFFVHYMDSDYSALIFGSLVMGVSGQSSDIDICLSKLQIATDMKHTVTKLKTLPSTAIAEYKTLHKSGTVGLFNQACSKLNKHLSFVKNLDVITAQVPLLSFYFPLFGTNVDISLDNSEGFQTGMCYNVLSRMDPRVAPYLFLVKQWSKQHNVVGRGMSETPNITNFMMLSLAMFYLMRRNPPVICNVFDVTKRIPLVGDWVIGGFRAKLKDSPLDYDTSHYDVTTSVEDLFLEFLEYYRLFDFGRRSPSLSLGETIINQKHDLLAIRMAICSEDLGKVTDLKATKKFSQAAAKQLKIIDGVRRKSKNNKPWGILKCLKVAN